MSTLTKASEPFATARPMMGRRNLLMWSAAAVVLAGCTDVNYVAPTADVASAFDGDAPPRNNNPEARMWWRAFRDPALDRLIAAGHARNLSVQQAVEAINQARAAADQVGANDLPQVNVTAGAERGMSAGSSVATTSSYVQPGASWMIDIFGGNRNARQAAAAQLDGAYLTADVARLTMENAIASTYINLRYFQESIALTRRSIASRKRSQELTKTQFDLGSASRLDVLQADQLVAEGEAALPAYETGFDQALASLAMLTAQRVSDIRPALQKGGSQPSARFRPSVGVPADVVRDRPDVRLAEREYAAAAFNVGVAKAAFYPSVSLSGSVTPTNISRPGSTSITYWAIGPTINLPIFTGGRNMANLKAAESQAVQAKLGWENSVLKAIEEVESGLAAYNRDGRNVAAQQRLVNTSRETTDLSRSSFEIGEGTFINVLDAERAYLAAQQALAGAIQQQAIDYVTLSVAAAGGTAAAAS